MYRPRPLCQVMRTRVPTKLPCVVVLLCCLQHATVLAQLSVADSSQVGTRPLVMRHAGRTRVLSGPETIAEEDEGTEEGEADVLQEEGAAETTQPLRRIGFFLMLVGGVLIAYGSTDWCCGRAAKMPATPSTAKDLDVDDPERGGARNGAPPPAADSLAGVELHSVELDAAEPEPTPTSSSKKSTPSKQPKNRSHKAERKELKKAPAADKEGLMSAAVSEEPEPTCPILTTIRVPASRSYDLD